MKKKIISTMVLALALQPGVISLATSGEKDFTDIDERLLNRQLLADLESMKEQQRGGGIFEHSEVLQLSLKEAARMAMERNLLVNLQGWQLDIARQGIEDALAVFDPQFNVNLSATSTKTYNRSSTEMRWKRGTVLDNDGINRIHFPSGPIRYLEYNRSRQAGYHPTEVVASESPVTGRDEQSRLSGTVSHLQSWGSRLSMTYQLTYKNAMYINNPDDPRRTAGSYGRPWTTGVSLQGMSPLPGTSGFGKLNQNKAGVRLAEMGSEDAALAIRAAVNDVLLALEHAYWDLAGAVMKLDIAREVELLSGELLARSLRMFEQRLITPSDLGQAEVEHARVVAAAEQALNGVNLAANQLGQLLDLPAGQIVLPEAYAAKLNETTEYTAAEELEINNPELARGLLALDRATLLRDVAENNARLPITVSALVRAWQSNDVFGHRTFGRSVGSGFDKLSYRVGISYQDGFRGRAAKAELEELKAMKEGQSLMSKQTELDLKNALAGSRMDFDSARARAAIAANNEKMALALYERSERMADAGNLARYQVVEALARLLESRQNKVNALVELKKAEANMLAVAGQLPTRYRAGVSLPGQQLAKN